MDTKMFLRLVFLIMFLCFGLPFQAGGQDNMTQYIRLFNRLRPSPWR